MAFHGRSPIFSVMTSRLPTVLLSQTDTSGFWERNDDRRGRLVFRKNRREKPPQKWQDPHKLTALFWTLII